MKIEKLKGRLKSLVDPRRTTCGNLRHKLEDIIIIGLCSTICGGEDFVDMEEFGKEREEFQRKFLELPSGIPDYVLQEFSTKLCGKSVERRVLSGYENKF